MSDNSAPQDETAPGSQSPLFGEKKCFIASPIGAAGSPERHRSNLVKRFIIDEAVNPLGYKTVRADEIDKSGEITTQIVGDLIDADLLIADLTGQNPNVFYELAIRHSFRKPYIQIVEKGEDLPFDVRAFRTVFVDHKDLESAADARSTIVKMVHDIESGGDVQSPVTHAVNRQQLETSQDPGKNELAQIGEIVERIDFRMRKLENREGIQSRRAATDRSAASELMVLLDKSVAQGKALGVDDLRPLADLAKATKSRELHSFLDHLEPHVAPF